MSEPPGMMGGYSDEGVDVDVDIDVEGVDMDVGVGVDVDVDVDVEAEASDVGDDMVKLFPIQLQRCVELSGR